MAARSEPGRTAWVSYLRVSTDRQAERQLSIPAQRHAVLNERSGDQALATRDWNEQNGSLRSVT